MVFQIYVFILMGVLTSQVVIPDVTLGLGYFWIGYEPLLLSSLPRFDSLWWVGLLLVRL